MTTKFFLFFITIGLLSSCKKDTNNPGFPMLYQANVTVPAGISSIAVHHFYIENISTRYSALLSEYNKTDSDIKRILLTRASLNGVFGDENYNFIDQVSLRLYKTGNVNDYVEIAYRYPSPLEPGNNLPLIPNDLDIKKYMKESRFNIDCVLWLRRTTQFESPTRIDLEFNAEY